MNQYYNWNFPTINASSYGFWNIWFVQYVMLLRNFMSTLYATWRHEINIYLNSECVTIDKICVTSYMFLCSKLYALPQCESVTRVKKNVTQWNNCNTILDIKEHMYCVPIGDTIVISRIGTLIRCVTRRPSNTFIYL